MAICRRFLMVYKKIKIGQTKILQKIEWLVRAKLQNMRKILRNYVRKLNKIVHTSKIKIKNAKISQFTIFCLTIKKNY